MHWVFSCKIYLESFGRYKWFLAQQCCPMNTKTTFNNNMKSFCEMLPGVRQHRQDCMEHFTYAMLFQNIKTTSKRIFSCARLSEASWGTLHKIFTCAMFSQEYWETMNKIFFLCNVVCSLLGNIVQSFYWCNVVPRVLRQHWTGFFLWILPGSS